MNTSNSTAVGTLGELAVQKELHRQGYNVYTPLCDVDQVDMIVETSRGDFQRLNVKTCSKLKTSTSMEIRLSKHANSNRVDCIAVYYIPEDIIAFIPYENQSSINLALRNAKNNQNKNRLWFWALTDYPEFE